MNVNMTEEEDRIPEEDRDLTEWANHTMARLNSLLLNDFNELIQILNTETNDYVVSFILCFIHPNQKQNIIFVGYFYKEFGEFIRIEISGPNTEFMDYILINHVHIHDLHYFIHLLEINRGPATCYFDMTYKKRDNIIYKFLHTVFPRTGNNTIFQQHSINSLLTSLEENNHKKLGGGTKKRRRSTNTIKNKNNRR